MEQLEVDLAPKVRLKWTGLLGVGSRYSFLRCERARTEEGTWILGDKRHTEKMINLLGLGAAKAVDTPMVRLRDSDTDESRAPLDSHSATLYRRCVGLARYDRAHRGDKSFVVKELSHGLASPTLGDMARLRRYVRYLKGCLDEGVLLPAGSGGRGVVQGSDVRPLSLHGYGDSDWAGQPTTRRSTSGGALVYSGGVVFDFSRSQSVVATSSAEAEFYAQVSLCNEGIHLKRVISFLEGEPVEFIAHCDSSAARAVASRQGAGKLKHVQVQTLWLQGAVKQKIVKMAKVSGERNLSDMMTKALDKKKLNEMKALNGIMDCTAARALPEFCVQKAGT